MANKSVLVPEVNPKLDDKAYKLIQDIYVDRTIVPVPAFLSSNWWWWPWMHHSTITQGQKYMCLGK